MAKEPVRGKQKKSTVSPAGMRTQLERVDRELVSLLNARAALALKLHQIEPGVDRATFEGDAGLLAINKGPLSAEALRAIYRELHSGIAAICAPKRVAFLGPAYSYSHVATLHRFGSSLEMIPVGTIGAVFEEVNRGHAHFGVVPIDNSTDGRVVDTLDMFTRLPVKICGEVQLRIHHNLLARCPRDEIREVYSRPQALSQCRNWLSRHLPAARPVEVMSTSMAAELAQSKAGAAAIASRQAGAYYGLDVLAENIEDNAANVTRFVVIGETPAPRTGRDRMSLMFEVEHKPGGLADAVQLFKKNRLNMTWIESFPIAGSDGRYMFFVEVDGHPADARVKKAIASLERKCLRFEVLGAYARTEPID